MATTSAKETYEIYTKSTFMIGFVEITGLHYEHESFDTNEEAVEWINSNGKKQKEYTIVKVYKRID